MKLIRILAIAAFAAAVLTGPVYAGDKSCCEKAKEAGKECTHKCCAESKKAGKTCEKCNPKKEQKEEKK